MEALKVSLVSSMPHLLTRRVRHRGQSCMSNKSIGGKWAVQNRHKRTYTGMTCVMYSGMNERSVKRWSVRVSFSLEEFRQWFEENGGKEKYDNWKKSDYNKWKRPSVDRINPLDRYHFGNMQVITHKENCDKGHREKEIFWGKKVIQSTVDGLIVAVHPSAKAATISLGSNNRNLINDAARRGSITHGFLWKYESNTVKHRTLKALATPTDNNKATSN